ncbi:MAG: HAD family hydrolase [Kiritimatiellae bacterium]|nr:HAD family hydrolase [Kiritimatiellia bacterium]
MIPPGFFDGVRCAVFDLDDTLYAFDGPGGANAPAMRALAAHAAPRLGISEDAFLGEVRASLDAQLARVGRDSPCYHSRAARFGRMLEARGLPLGLALEWTEFYWRELFARVAPAPGAAALLRALRGRGVRVGVGTDMTALEQFRKLDALGLLDLVDFVATSEEAGVEKPEPGFFALVADKAGCAPADVFFAGDNLRKDALGAAAAGMRGLWLQPDAGKRAERPDVPAAASLEEIRAAL